MTAVRVLAAVAAFACTAQSPEPRGPFLDPGAPQAASPQPLSGDQIFARAKAVFRSYPRPPFVAYTLVRRDLHNGAPDFENSYTLKLWCRTADRSALARKAWKGKAYGQLENLTVMFDRRSTPDRRPPTCSRSGCSAPSAPGATSRRRHRATRRRPCRVTRHHRCR